MQLTKANIVQMIGIIQANYAYAYKDTPKSSLALMSDVWFNSLKVYPKEVVSKVFQYTIEKSTYPPTLADIISNLKQIIFSSYPNENTLWNEILNAVKTASQIYYFGEQFTIDGEKPKDKLQKVFDSLNEISREWLGDVTTLKNMRNLDITSLACEKARFNKDLPRIMEGVFLQKRCSTLYITEAINNKLLINTATHTENN